MLFSLRCLLLGHDDWYVRSPERLKLRCQHCGRETPGWALTRPEASRPTRVTSLNEKTAGLPRLPVSQHA
jgi:hypothetical protein